MEVEFIVPSQIALFVHFESPYNMIHDVTHVLADRIVLLSASYRLIRILSVETEPQRKDSFVL